MASAAVRSTYDARQEALQLRERAIARQVRLPAARSRAPPCALRATTALLMPHGAVPARWCSRGRQEAAIQRARAVAHGRRQDYAGSHIGDEQATAGTPSASSRPVPVFGCVWRAQWGPRMHVASTSTRGAGGCPPFASGPAQQHAARVVFRRPRRRNATALRRLWASRGHGAWRAHLASRRRVLPACSVRLVFLRRALSRDFT